MYVYVCIHVYIPETDFYTYVLTFKPMYVLTFILSSGKVADVGGSNFDPLSGNILLFFSFVFFLSFILDSFISTRD